MRSIENTEKIMILEPTTNDEFKIRMSSIYKYFQETGSSSDIHTTCMCVVFSHKNRIH